MFLVTNSEIRDLALVGKGTVKCGRDMLIVLDETKWRTPDLDLVQRSLVENSFSHPPNPRVCQGIWLSVLSGYGMNLVGDNLTQPVVKLYHKALACRGMARGFWSHEPETDSQVCCQSSTERAKLSLLPAPIVSQPLGLGSGQCTMESIYSVCPNFAR